MYFHYLGEDPLKDVKNATDTNSISGLLKLYFRELKEPLFPFYLFDLLTGFINTIYILTLYILI